VAALEPQSQLAKGQAAAAKKCGTPKYQPVVQLPASSACEAGLESNAAAAAADDAMPSASCFSPPGVVLNPRCRAVVPAVALPAALLAGGAAPGHAAASSAGAGGGCADVTLMRNTSWLVPGVLMASSTPKRPEHVRGSGLAVFVWSKQ
jgi:hypothetical protein